MEPSTLGVRIRSLREERQWTLSHLARLAGIDRSTLGKVERGDYRGTPPWYVRKLARAFGIATDVLHAMDMAEEDIIDQQRHSKSARLRD